MMTDAEFAVGAARIFAAYIGVIMVALVVSAGMEAREFFRFRRIVAGAAPNRPRVVIFPLRIIVNWNEAGRASLMIWIAPENLKIRTYFYFFGWRKEFSL